MKEPPSLWELTRGERRFLISLGVGTGVLIVGFIIGFIIYVAYGLDHCNATCWP